MPVAFWRIPVVLFALLVAASPAEGATPARTPARYRASQGLRASERDQLVAGDVVARPLTLERGRGHYVGGVSYQLVHARPDDVVAALASVDTLPQVLPHTKSARLIEVKGHRARVELVQGNTLVEARYTLELERVPGSDELKFWLDRSRPHDIDDVYGYFRVRRFDRDRSLVTVAVALDVGPGLVRMLFEDRIQRVILATPAHIKQFIEPRAFADAR